ncbi:MAG: sigma-70 family RNA polymerase sigma factor [Deltaproteobacteria bacterium]|nr:sigma-70 family RNA polymerase sigma factor [Deltaproteobacteria bacterium]
MMAKPNIHLVNSPETRQLGDFSDDDLMLLARANREDAFEVLIKRHQSLVLGLSVRYFADHSMGTDVTQDVFLALWAERERYRARGKFRSYLYSMTLHRCHVVARQRKSHRNKQSKLTTENKARATHTDQPLDALLDAERAREVRELLTHLPPKMRRVMILRFTQELPLEDIASLTDQPLGTIKSHLFRGIRRLAKLLKEERP